MISGAGCNNFANRAAAEIDGVWSNAAGALFSRELLESVTADLEVPALSELRGPARGIAGCDYGASWDRSALAAVYRLPVAPLRRDLRRLLPRPELHLRFPRLH